MTKKTDETNVRTLEEALAEPRKHRDMAIAKEPMPNFTCTPESPNLTPMGFSAAWALADRPRRIALLMDDCQEEYRAFAEPILPNLQKTLAAFRKRRAEGDGVCIVWSAWSRRFDDGISNAMDRWYGPRGLDPANPQNAVYVYTGAPGLKPMSEIAPSSEDVADGWFYYGKHLDMFWTFDDHGRSYLDEKLKAHAIDTIVIAGLWTDECVLSTAYAGSSRGYDVVVVGDAVATATANQEIALKVAGGTVAKVVSTEELFAYMERDFAVGLPGAVKGTTFPDGRKDD